MDIIAKDSKIQFLPLDFPSSEAYQQWKRSELAILQGFYQSLVARFGAPTINSIQIDDSMIPQDPQNVYNELQIKCLEYNLRNSKENKLSKSCIQILAECAIRWGVCKRYRDISLLDVMIEKYRAHFLALNDIQQQVSIVVKTCCDYKINSKFTTIFAQTTLSKLFNLLSNNIINFYRDNEITDVKIQTSIKIIESIAPLLEINNLNETLNEYISEGVNLRYMELNNQTNDSVEITRLLNLTRALNNQVSKYGVVYSGLGLDVKLIAAEIFLKYLILELGNINTGDDYTIKEVLDLYQSTKMLYQVCEAAKSSISMPPNDFNVENWFHPFIISYLELADLRCLEWVKPAVLVDDFKPCYPPFTMSSTSVLDIFMSVHQGIDFIENFAWRESGRREMLAKKFVSTLSKSLKEYCTLLFQDFKELQKSTTPRVLFPTKLLVEINNLIESRTKLLEILSKLGVNYDSFDEYAKHTEPDSTQATFRITIIRASGLESYSKDWTSLDPYLVLKHKNVELMRTSTIQKSKNPIWAQSFTINLSNDMPDSECFLDLVIYDKELLKDAETAKTSLFMRDILYSDFLSHKIKKQLSPKGRIELLVCKIGEIESVGWYVKNTEQAIDATIDDMVSVLIDDIAKSFTRSISHISEGSLMSLFSSSGTASDDKIEKQMTPFLEYLDSCLGLFNEYLDPRLNEFMLDRHAWISTLAAVTGKNAVYVLATMVWIQLLREMTLFVFKNKKKENKELIKSICDILKIVFYCNGLGIPLVELENEFYSDLKRLLKM